MKSDWIFLIIVFLANIIQGVTGFAGTVLAMPAGLFFVDLSVAKPLLNFLGILAGVQVCVISWKKIQFGLWLRVIIIMGAGILLGWLFSFFLQRDVGLQYKILGLFVTGAGLYNLGLSVFRKELTLPDGVLYILLLTAGIIHGMFVTGGPLLVIYLSQRIKGKSEFRATISLVWIFLNSMILIQELLRGDIVPQTIMLTAISVPLLFAGIFIGNLIHRRINQSAFLKLSYVLLIVSGASLLFK